MSESGLDYAKSAFDRAARDLETAIEAASGKLKESEALNASLHDLVRELTEKLGRYAGEREIVFRAKGARRCPLQHGTARHYCALDNSICDASWLSAMEIGADPPATCPLRKGPVVVRADWL